jgi:tetratricopeptide (TPR) repeat protein
MKKGLKYWLLASGFWFLAISCFSQPNTDEQLAFQYLQNKEFDKAVVYYEKFFSKKDGISYYNPYLLCLTQLKQYDKAEKMIKKVIKQYPYDLTYLVDLGTLYKDQKQEEKGNTQYEKAIKQLKSEQQQIIALANEFIQLQEWDYAIATYKEGKRLMNGFYPFSAEIAGVYEKKGDIHGMVSEYLSLLDYGDDQLQAVQNGLQPSFGEDKDEKKNDIIKEELLKKVQASPERTSYTELLIWFFIQEKNFNGAFIQSKALDKRLHEDGQRLMALGQLCVSNEDYEAAAKCYQYVVEKGRDNYNYINARMELLNAQYKRVTTKFNFTQADLSELENNFNLTINELGKSSGTAILVKNLAHLEGFFMNKTKEAAALLNETIKLPGINEKTQAECKLELGDILLMTGQVWDASLLYSQVDLDFKHEPLGDEAKLRNAKLSYYNGEFKWSQAQLDVLKGSTEKLISNDAMELSLLISDNSHNGGDDSLALCIFARADLLSFRNETDKALLTLDSITQKFQTSPLADDILYKKYKIKMKQGKFTEAAEQLQKLLDNYSYDILGDDALFKLAELNELYLNNTEKAKELYEDLLTRFPGSLYTVEARKRFRRLRGDGVN